MREIKFRAWNKRNNKMGYLDQLWNDDWYSHPKNTQPGIAWENCNRVMGSGKDFELMQFTGLHDKNGKEIFEGDIIRTGMRRGYSGGWTNSFVEYSEGRWVLSDKNMQRMQMQWDQELREIIGNIYQSPDLLK